MSSTNLTPSKSQTLLHHHLKALKLPTILRECEKTANLCAGENADHPTFLLRLAEAELLEREQKSTQRRMKEARFPSPKTLDGFDFAVQPSINKALVSELMRGVYIAAHENVLLMGSPGTGKTHLATALGMAACALGRRVRFFRTTELITQMMEARDDRQLTRLRGQSAVILDRHALTLWTGVHTPIHHEGEKPILSPWGDWPGGGTKMVPGQAGEAVTRADPVAGTDSSRSSATPA